jgi:hypothetical protein
MQTYCEKGFDFIESWHRDALCRYRCGSGSGHIGTWAVLRGVTLASDFLLTVQFKMNTSYVLFLMLQTFFFQKSEGPLNQP